VSWTCWSTGRSSCPTTRWRSRATSGWRSSPPFTREVLIACYEAGLSLIDVHTHPFADADVGFSGLDEANMRVTHAEFLARMPDRPPVGVASLVLGRRGMAGAVTNPASGELAPLDRLSLLGTSLTEVALCSN